MDPDKGEGIGGVVVIVHLYEAVKGTFGVIEADVDGVVDLLLPVCLCGGGEAGCEYK
jgi:hypothetical protein